MAITTAAAIAATAVAGSSAYAANRDSKNAKASVKSQERQKAQSQAFIESQMKQTRGELFKLYPSIQDSQQKGLAAGLDMYKQMVPMQLNSFRQGNMGAQKMVAGALPQIQNAILGRRVDLSGIQPVALDAPQFQVPQAPQFQGIGGLMGDIPPELLAQIAAGEVR